MIRKFAKRSITMALATVMTISLAACGNKDTANQQDSGDVRADYVYVPEYFTINEADESGNSSYSQMNLVGNDLYYSKYVWDDSTAQSSYDICKYSLTDQSNARIASIVSDNGGLNAMQADAEGNIYTVEYQYSDGEGEAETQQTWLRKYNAEGIAQWEQELTAILSKDEENTYASGVCIDGQGRIYLKSETVVRLFDEQGQYQGDISIGSSWLQNFGKGKDGKVYASYFDSSSAGYVLTELDFDNKKLGQTYTGFPSESSSNGNLQTGINSDFLVNSSGTLYEYSIADQKTSEVLQWLDSDINGDYVNYVAATEDGDILAVIIDWNTNEMSLAKLKKTPASEVTQKTQIVIGTLYTDQALQAAAVRFNKNNTQYHVSIKTYVDENNWTDTTWSDAITALNNDIVSGTDCPDILDLSNLDVKALASKGVFEDITPYLENSTVLDKDDFFQSILDSYTFDGKLVGIPQSFMLNTVVGKTADVGDKMGWTIDDVMALSQKYPDAELFDGMTKASMLYMLVGYDLDSYIDWTTGKCNFDSENFQKVLEFINTFPEDYTYDENEKSTPAKIQARELLLNTAGIYQLESIQESEGMFGEAVTFVGYPNDNGTAGCYMSANSLYAIASKSANKDGAWTFIEDLLNSSTDEAYSYGLPSRKSALNELIEKEMNPSYLLDENGNQILDENGNPIPEGGGSISWGDWEYTYHTPTQEEVDILMQLIDASQPITVGNDEITNIITEEAEAFFKGQKSVADVANVIQSRVQIYVNENK